MADYKDYAEGVAASLIEHLEKGTAPWQKPWKPGERFMPYNPTTGNEYRGINAVWLMSVAGARGYDDARWMTYNQSAKIGAQVRKGEKASVIEKWTFEVEKTVVEDGQPVKKRVELERPYYQQFKVFNAAQIDGLPAPDNRPALTEWERHERAEAILSASQARIDHVPGDRAFYRPSEDRIVLPERSQFETSDRYYATALHELGHWTGHSTRLDRDLAHPFGSDGYAKEELRAEIASMMLGEQLSIGHDPEQHVAYVGSWIKALKDDPREVFRAARDAQAITKFVRGFEQSQQIEQTAGNTVQITAPSFTPPSEVAVKTSDERVYLAVPYGEKNEAKALGARWDKSFGDKGSWYAPAGTDLSALSRWMPGQGNSVVATPEESARDEFSRALREAGLVVSGGPVMDGEWHRVPLAANPKGDKDGAYRGFLDGKPNGDIHNWKSGEKVKWQTDRPVEQLSAQDRARQAAENANKKAQEAKQRAQQAELVSAAVDAHIAAGEPASNDHPYLARKGVGANGAVVDRAGTISMPPGDEKPQPWSKPGNLLIPVRDLDGNIMGAQSIDPADGQKSFARGGRVMDGNFLIGDLATPGPLLIAEGFATGATLHEATGLPVAVAFNSGNLAAVAKGYRERYPDRALLVAGDNDHRKELELGPDGQPKPNANVGKVKAEDAAAAVGGATLLPPFKPEDRGSDWNDFAASRDRETFMRELRSGFAIAQRQALTKEAKAERLAPQLTQDQARVQERETRRLPELEGVKQTHKRAHAR